MKTLTICLPILAVLFACVVRAENADKAEPQDRAPTILMALHKDTVKAFVDGPGFGFDRMWTPRHTIRPSADILYTFLMGGQRWHISDLRLIGVINHGDKPVVYENPTTVADKTLAKRSMPVKPVGDESPLSTHAPDEFEATALADFRTGKSLSVKIGANEIRVVGALRATNNCISCHTESKTTVNDQKDITTKAPKAGDLFGAFTYRIERIPEPAELKDDMVQKIARFLQQITPPHSQN